MGHYKKHNLNYLTLHVFEKHIYLSLTQYVSYKDYVGTEDETEQKQKLL